MSKVVGVGIKPVQNGFIMEVHQHGESEEPQGLAAVLTGGHEHEVKSFVYNNIHDVVEHMRSIFISRNSKEGMN